ncbi:MAG: hypothetical protein DBX59_04930 [Bacillota bacterium]|nr:MAG: hypothetical protein DBX59_04930 [Bacillota bacterium]
MRTVSVPVIYNNGNFDRIALLKTLRRTGANRVMLAIYRVVKNGRVQTAENMAGLAEEIAFFEGEGFEVCVWIGETIGHGWPINETSDYTNVVNIRGNVGYAAYCPTDEKFTDDICEWIKNVAKAGAKQILLDDDFRMTNHGGDGSSASCLCENHMKIFCSLVGEELSREEIVKKVFSGGKSKYRDAWLEMMKDTVLSFAKKIRAAVDEVDRGIRIGLCGTASMMDVDGAATSDAVKILAGKNKRLWRSFGAPYWAKNGFDLAQVLLTERLAARWIDRENLEIICEGDTYPRPRLACPAAYLEIFDQALAADGCYDGILKYMLEYAAPYDYETGFVDRHVKNAALLKAIEETFKEGDAVGLNLFERAECFRNAELTGGDPYANAEYAVWAGGHGVHFAAGVCAPVAFGGDYPAVVIGENARYIEKSALKNGAIVDVVAAKILQERGIDVGMESITPVRDIVGTEHFLSENIHVTTAQPVYFHVETKNGAETLTYLEGKNRHTGAYRYVNAEGLRFLVYAFDGERSDKMLYRCYARQREIVRETEWLCGRKLPASCAGHPDIYLFCKQTEDGLAVGFWNLFPDDIPLAEIALSRPYGAVEWLSGKGELCGDKVKIEEIAPYTFVGFKVKL